MDPRQGKNLRKAAVRGPSIANVVFETDPNLQCELLAPKLVGRLSREKT